MRLTAKADAAVVLAAIAVIILINAFTGGEGGKAVIVSADGRTEVYYTTLTEKTEYSFVTESGTVVVAVDSEGAYFVSSPCRDKICVKSGRVDSAGECAACVPCHVYIYIESSGEGADGMTG